MIVDEKDRRHDPGDSCAIGLHRCRARPSDSICSLAPRAHFPEASPLIVLSALPRTASGLSTHGGQCNVFSEYVDRVPIEYR